MADKKLQVSINHTSLLPRDAAINVLYFDINAPDTVIGTMDDVAVAYQGLAVNLNKAYQGLTIKAYDMPSGSPPTSGPPTHVKSYGFVSTNGDTTPCELALCLSYSADDNVAGTKRRRGRIYFPFSAEGAKMRPVQTALNNILTFGQALASAGNAGNTTWKMFSPTDGVTRKIESISCDNEWDVQRRRGLRATTRTRQDVQ